MDNWLFFNFKCETVKGFLLFSQHLKDARLLVNLWLSLLVLGADVTLAKIH